jgi:hypothetical protein
VQQQKFQEAGVDMHKNEVMSLEDDHKKGKRIISLKNTKYFDMGRGRG